MQYPAYVLLIYLESNETVEFRESYKVLELQEFFEKVVSEYLEWVANRFRWCGIRDASIKTLQFPFRNYRIGQRQLAVAVYRAIQNRGKLFAEAPTGIGKTISVLFPTIKAFPEGNLDKIFYLTAKTIGRTVAENAVTDLRAAGLSIKSVTLTAKEKVCIRNGQSCDVRTCPLAIGYYDRIKAALRDGLQNNVLSREQSNA